MYDLNKINEMLDYINHPLSMILKDSSKSPLYMANPEKLKSTILQEIELYENIRKINCKFDETIKKELYNYDINNPGTMPESLIEKEKELYLEAVKFVNPLKVMQFTLIISSPLNSIVPSSIETDDIKNEADAFGKKVIQEQATTEFVEIDYLYGFELLKFKTIFMLLENFINAKDY